ncbi:MAG: hypothetical protein R3B68_05335 [Phycisphaerales bacterium]
MTDEELLDTLERTIVCEVGASGYTISMGSGVNRRSESHPTLVFNLSGVMQDGHGGWVGGDYIRHALVDDRLAFTHGGMAGSARIGFMLQFSLERAYFEGSEPHEILVSRSISTTTPEGFQTDKCWVIMLEVPQLNAAGLPSGQVRLRHEIRSDDPVRSAVSAWRAEQDRANMARMTGQQRETPAPAPSSP